MDAGYFIRNGIIYGGGVVATSNPNLLDNPWFTVNQRGASSYTGSKYTVDRWYVNDGNSVGTLNVTSDGVSYVRTATTSNPFLLWQKAETILPIATYTLSVKYKTSRNISGKSSYRLLATRDTTSTNLAYLDLPTSSDWSIATLTFTTNEKLAIGMIIQDRGATDGGASIGDTIEVACVKLEIGSVSTLHLDTAPNYATELLKCQRYFVRLKQNSGKSLIGIGMAGSANNLATTIMLPIEMRTIPAVSVSDATDFYYGTNSAYTTMTEQPTSVTRNGGTAQQVGINYNKTGAFTVGQMYGMAGKGYIDFTADL